MFIQAIEKQKETLERDNAMFKSLLKQYLDGISVNDDVMNSNNPLLVVNHKINLANMPVESETVSGTYIEGNAAIAATMHQLGYIPRQGI